MRVFLLISSFPSQTNNQVHRSPKCFFPSAHFIQRAETAASMFKTGQLCSDQLTLEAQLGQPNRQYSNCKQMRQHLRRRDRSTGNGHGSIHSFLLLFQGQLLVKARFSARVHWSCCLEFLSSARIFTTCEHGTAWFTFGLCSAASLLSSYI